MKYLTVGTNEITEEKFRTITNNPSSNSIKPIGGLWMTNYNEDIKNYNLWVDFILEHPYILFYKNTQSSPWVQPCSIVTLKDTTNLFKLDDYKELDYLLKKYPFENDKFSYQQLSQHYDGIYIDIEKLINKNIDYEMSKKFSSFGVNSTVLFNLECIDYYQLGSIAIEPFDYEFNNQDTYYEINYEKTKKKILKRN